MALLGPASEFPRMVLGRGVEPTRESKPKICDPYSPHAAPPPYDPEDGRVLDLALSGKSDALVTENFKDLKHYADNVIVRDRVHFRRTAGHDFWIIQPEEMLDWLTTGNRPRGVPKVLMRNRQGGAARPTDAPEGEPEP